MTTTVEDFHALNLDVADRLCLRFVQKAAANPKQFGYHESVKPCGCEHGFVTVNQSSQTTVRKCDRCQR